MMIERSREMNTNDAIATGFFICLGLVGLIAAVVGTCIWFSNLKEKINDIHRWSKK